MCLALVGKVTEVSGKKATVDFAGTERRVNAEFLKPEPGDRVMVFNDFIIEKVEDG
jgi:hydrogenase expression/formation protein HypC